MADFDKQYYVNVSVLVRTIARKKEVKKGLRQEEEISPCGSGHTGKVLEHVKVTLRKLKVGPLMREYVATERLMSQQKVPLEQKLVRDHLRCKAAI